MRQLQLSPLLSASTWSEKVQSHWYRRTMLARKTFGYGLAVPQKMESIGEQVARWACSKVAGQVWLEFENN